MTSGDLEDGDLAEEAAVAIAEDAEPLGVFRLVHGTEPSSFPASRCYSRSSYRFLRFEVFKSRTELPTIVIQLVFPSSNLTDRRHDSKCDVTPIRRGCLPSLPWLPVNN